MKINSMQLLKELEAAGIETNGCNSNGVVWDKDNREIQDLPEVKAVMVRHNPKEEELPDDRIANLEKEIWEIKNEIKTMKGNK